MSKPVEKANLIIVVITILILIAIAGVSGYKYYEENSYHNICFIYNSVF